MDLPLGSIYGLIAIGYTMVYGIIVMINFAHGDIFMIGDLSFDKKSDVILPGHIFYKWSEGKCWGI